MRVVLDTNILISALLWGGVPYRLLQLAQSGEIKLITSPTLIAELADVLGREYLSSRIAAQNLSAEQLSSQYCLVAQMVLPQNVLAVIAADADDDHVLACALEGRADLIVSGDKHLHSLGGQYQGILIVKAIDALKIIGVGFEK